jgi:hypothetical protein
MIRDEFPDHGVQNCLASTTIRFRTRLFAFLICVTLVSAGTSLQAQSFGHSDGPQPDDAPVVEPISLSEILSSDAGKINFDQVKRALQLVANQINALQRELATNNPKTSCQPPRAVAKNARLQPTDEGVYAGKFYPPGQPSKR